MKKKINKTKSNDVSSASGGAGAGRPAAVDYVKFVEVWARSGSLTEVADAMGIKRNSASAIAGRLRKKGVTNLLPFRRRDTQPIDVDRLNRIASGKPGKAKAGKARVQ